VAVDLSQARPRASQDESDAETSRLDRELIELLNELRVVLPGVQALFAFLLIVPFNQRFEQLTDAERLIYLVALLTAALACVVFISVPIFHRLRFREHDKAQLLRVGNRATIAGTVLLAIAMVAAVFLITELIFGDAAAVVITAALGIVVAGLWWILPLVVARAD
jgi:amino acid transporter